MPPPCRHRPASFASLALVPSPPRSFSSVSGVLGPGARCTSLVLGPILEYGIRTTSAAGQGQAFCLLPFFGRPFVACCERAASVGRSN
eukprot:scaffold207737_cov39-Tisochrysis_lutea.AAC.2